MEFFGDMHVLYIVIHLRGGGKGQVTLEWDFLVICNLIF